MFTYLDIVRSFREHFHEPLVKAAAKAQEDRLETMIRSKLEEYHEKLLARETPGSKVPGETPDSWLVFLKTPDAMADMLVVLKEMAACSGSWRTRLVNRLPVSASFFMM